MPEPEKGNGKPEVAKALRPIDEVRGALLKMEPQFAMVLPPHISPAKFIRVLMTAAQENPDLINADRQSLYSAAMKCAQDGLIPDKREAVILAIKGVAVYWPMIGGILKKVRNSGELATISAHVVYDHDQFEYELGDNERILHRPMLEGDRGKPKLVYAIAKTKDGGIYREIMTREQVMQVKAMSKAPGSLMWTAFEDEGWKKVCMRRLSKRLPMSTDLEQLFQRDDELYDFIRKPTQAAVATGGKGRSRVETIVEAETGGTGAAQPAIAAGLEVPL